MFRIPKALILLLLFISVIYSSLAIIRHNRFESGAFDLGIYDQTVWQYSHFEFPYNTIKERLILGDHLTLTLPLLAPLYWIWSDVRMLLIFQSVWLAVSAMPIYFIARLRNLSFSSSLALAFLYSLFPGIQFAVFFDFHPVIIGVGLLSWIAYFLEKRAYLFMWVGVLLLVLTQENMGIALASLGFIYIFDKRYRPFAWAFILIGGVSSAIAIKIVSLFSPIGFEYSPILPKNLNDAVVQFFDQAEKRQSWLYSFGWYSFLPILSTGSLFATFLDLSQYFLTGNGVARMWSPFTHHRAILAPILTLGIVQALSRFKDTVRFPIGVIISVLILVSLTQQYIYHYPINKLVKNEFWRSEQWMRDANEIINIVPEAYAVAAQHNFVPHLSHRKEIYLTWPRSHTSTDSLCAPLRIYDTRECWWLDFSRQANYLVVDTRPGQWLTQILTTDDHFAEAIENMEKRGFLRVIKSIGTVRLYTVSWQN